MQTFYSILGVILGVLILKYKFKIRKFFGLDSDMERIFLGLGGTYFFLTLLGLAIIILSLMFMFGFFSP